MLSARPARPIRVHLEVLVLDVDRDLVGDVGIHEHRSEGGVAPGVGIERADAHQAMHSLFRLQVAERVVAFDLDSGPRDAAFFPLLDVHHLVLVVVPLHPLRVHAQQHHRPVLAFRSASAGMHGQDRASEIIGIAEHRPEFELLHAVHQAGHESLELLRERLVLFVEQLDHVPSVAELALEGVVALDPLLVLFQLGQDGASALVVVPEVGLRAPDLERGYAITPRGEVKDSSRGDPTSPPGRSAGACTRVRRSCGKKIAAHCDPRSRVLGPPATVLSGRTSRRRSTTYSDPGKVLA